MLRTSYFIHSLQFLTYLVYLSFRCFILTIKWSTSEKEKRKRKKDLHLHVFKLLRGNRRTLIYLTRTGFVSIITIPEHYYSFCSVQAGRLHWNMVHLALLSQPSINLFSTGTNLYILSACYLSILYILKTHMEIKQYRSQPLIL